MFYVYAQNNSNARFDFDKEAGITHYVVIEADNADEADIRAFEIGLYFGFAPSDCSHCGSRWKLAEESRLDPEETIEPHMFLVEDVPSNRDFVGKKEMCVHYLNGTKEWF